MTNRGGELYTSMTIRENFASMAMQGCLASIQISTDPKYIIDGKYLASAALIFADALIAELNRTEDKKHARISMGTDQEINEAVARKKESL